MVNIEDQNTSECMPTDKDVDFLESGIPPHKKSSMLVENSGSQKKVDDVPEHIRDAETMTATELIEKYKLTHNSHRNMKQRKKKGAIIAQEFHNFRDFLCHVGPRYSAEYTLDRNDNSDPEYAPDKVQWRDKHAQNKNKGNNIFLTYKGATHTISEWAKITKTNPSTLYKRHSNGWSPEEVITGNRNNESINPFTGTPWPEDNQHVWEGRYQEAVLTGKFGDGRLEYLVKISRQLFKASEKLCEECDAYEEEEINAVHEKFIRWRNIYVEAYRKLELVNNRQRFIKRKTGSLGCEKEAALFYLINKEK